MEWMETNCYWLIWAAAAAILLIFYILHRKKIRTFLLGSISGIGTLLLLHFYGDAIGFAPTLCLTNLLISAILGVPGVVLLLLADILLR